MLPRLLIGWLTLTLLGCSVSAQKAEPTRISAKIIGQVHDPQGIPVAKAEVVARCECAWSGRLPDARTDAKGRFSIYISMPGTFRLYAAKEEQFFPLTDSPFYGVDSVPAPRLTVNDNDVLDAGTVLLHSQAGKLAVRVVDAETGTRVRDARIAVRRNDNPNAVMGSDLGGDLTELVPAAVALQVEARSEGYDDYYYGGDGTKAQSSPIYAEAKATTEITIPLRRARPQR
jgi:hypothetical protein